MPTTKTTNIRLRDEIAEEAWKHVRDHKKASLNALVNDIVADALSANQRPWMPPGLTPLAQELRDAAGTEDLWAFMAGLGGDKRELVVGKIESCTPVMVQVDLYDCPSMGRVSSGKSFSRYLALSELVTWLRVEITDQHREQSVSLDAVLGVGAAPPERVACINALAGFPILLSGLGYGDLSTYDPKRGLLFEEQAAVRRSEILEGQQSVSVLSVSGSPIIVNVPAGGVVTCRLSPLEADPFYRICGVRARALLTNDTPRSLQMTGFRIGGGVDLLPTDNKKTYEPKTYPLSDSWVEVGSLELRDFPILRYPNSAEVEIKNTSDLPASAEVEVLVTPVHTP